MKYLCEMEKHSSDYVKIPRFKKWKFYYQKEIIQNQIKGANLYLKSNLSKSDVLCKCSVREVSSKLFT